jgi:hypothetical protein
MSKNRHPERQVLIDFVEGDLPHERLKEIRGHLKECDDCRSYVESLRHTYALLTHDTVPEPRPGFSAYLAQRARQRAQSRRRRPFWVLVPGVAAAAVVLAIVWWGNGVDVAEPDSIDLLLAEMNTGEVVESVSGSSTYDEFLHVASDEISVLEEFIIETEDIDGLLSVLTDGEKDDLVSELTRIMGIENDEGTS